MRTWPFWLFAGLVLGLTLYEALVLLGRVDPGGMILPKQTQYL